MKPLYFDHNATTPVWPEVVEAVSRMLSVHFGNPSSHHAYGIAAREAVAEARAQMASLLACDPEEIVFTSGGSESNNLALKGVFDSGRAGGRLITSNIEHPAIAQVADYLAARGVSVTEVPADAEGVVQVADVVRALTPDTRLVSIMLANNEVGTIQPIAEIARQCHARGILVHTDAAQAVGKIPVRVSDLGVDLLSVAGHKMYAPKGVGALYIKEGVELVPLIHGAAHERGLRAGTENTALIAGLGVAAQKAEQGLDAAYATMLSLRDRLAQKLRDGIPEPLLVHGESADRLPNTLSVSFPRVHGYDLLARASDVAASTGAACHSGADIRSRTLKAMQVDPDIAAGTVRLSLGWTTTEAQVDEVADRLIQAWQSLLA